MRSMLIVLNLTNLPTLFDMEGHKIEEFLDAKGP